MYAEYFGLSEPPFSIAPDPRYLFPSAQHREALAHLAYGATEGDGFIQLTGEVGTGKTTLVRRLLAEMPAGVEIAFLFNPEVSRRALLLALLAELGLPRPPPTSEHSELLARLYRHLLAAHTRGHRVVLVIDEAQRLGPEVLEEVRLLTNFETDRRKLLNVILVGQPELRTTLARPDLRQLAQRITARYHLGPLSLADTDAYIRHRLRLAGAPGRIFGPRAVRAVHRHSRGIPRLINLICDRALMAAYTRGLREVDAAVVAEAVHELAGVAAPSRRWHPAWFVSAALLAGLVGAAIAWWVAGDGPAAPRANASAAVAAVTAGSALAGVPPVAISTSAAAAASVTTAVTMGSAENPIRQWVAAAPAASADAAGELFALWGVTGVGVGDPCAAAAVTGLACLHKQGNLNLLRVFDRPAVVSLNDAGEPVAVVVEALGGDKITLALGPEQRRTFAVADFERLWYGRMWLLWRPPQGTSLLRPGMRGAAIVWLRSALGLPAAGDDAVYGNELAEAVREFQRRHALVPDGIAGPETLIVLQRVLGTIAGPHLSEQRRAG
ncbi:MAG: AAA family ATPase [Gammaproteobacteria bacterium]